MVSKALSFTVAFTPFSSAIYSEIFSSSSYFLPHTFNAPVYPSNWMKITSCYDSNKCLPDLKLTKFLETQDYPTKFFSTEHALDNVINPEFLLHE